MWYIVDSGPVEVVFDKELIEQLETVWPAGLTFNDSKTIMTLIFDDEGFDLSDYAPFFRCAKKDGNFMVYVEDHKGSDQYGVDYGPGHCEEE